MIVRIHTQYSYTRPYTVQYDGINSQTVTTLMTQTVKIENLCVCLCEYAYMLACVYACMYRGTEREREIGKLKEREQFEMK